MNRSLFTVLSFLSLFGPVTAQETEWADFAVDWSRSPESPVSLAGLLDRPAGKEGFVRVGQGHLVRPSGRRFRIWGVNLTARATLPSREAAPQLADQLAWCGVNCVRFHFLDRLAPHGLIDASREDTCMLDPGNLAECGLIAAGDRNPKRQRG